MTDLTALVGSRICHDLISPLGAIGNGMELIEMSPGAPGKDELALIADSVARANGRIRLFRLAFGAAAHDAEVGAEELTAILADYYGGSRIEIVIHPPPRLPRSLAKVALLATLCAELALPRGGRIAIEAPGGTLRITAESNRLAADPRLWDPLADRRPHDPDLSAAEVQFALLQIAAAEAGCTLSLSRQDTWLEIAL
ncbi:histidine phosphotransferase ChpT [Rhodovulum sp. ES.010]|uniref:histidine phosphotransferase family protein n=1 Tax=Rhodovulum sp. ES.010 TaxID=1882821 RepID=UPI00092C7FDD|nr:histidine phosphotransferase family protein [Rhodovulum sp. ES.010]SIO21389.1 histidine phosphotransferase ChpT [Rhodovulum sp. ES.010]